MTLSPSQRIDLEDKMSQAFNLSEIEGLCFGLDINHEDVPGASRREKVRELILYCERHGRSGDLLAAARAARPHIAWPAAPAPAPGAGNTYTYSAHAESGGQANVTNNIGVPAPAPAPAPPPARKITVLFLAANPKDTDRLRLDEEVRTIDERLRLSQFRDRFVLQQQWAARVPDILDAMLRHTPDIVHFSGHGNRAGKLAFEDAAGNAQPVSAAALGALFAELAGVRCVVLNACWADKHADAIAASVDCVVGMARSVGDDAAISFASGFYRSLGEGLSVQRAFNLGKVQMMLGDTGDQAAPQLRVKPGVDAAALAFGS
jgi:hypothetical protein